MNDREGQNSEKIQTELSSSARKVQDTLKALGFKCEVIELPASTRTAQEAADAVGCEIGQIIKSLVFMGKTSKEPVLILASGCNRVDEKLVSRYLGEKIVKADADFVKEKTGFVIGGIPPVGHVAEIKTLIDRDLLNYDYLWAAAGTPHAVFELSQGDLKKISTGEIVDIHTM